jgi:hypothetical protein
MRPGENRPALFQKRGKTISAFGFRPSDLTFVAAFPLPKKTGGGTLVPPPLLE